MRRWVIRGGCAVLLYAAAQAGLYALRAHADPVRLALLVLLFVAVATLLLLDSTSVLPTAWATTSPDGVRLARLDPRTASHLRLLEGHLSARTVDDGLRHRLRDLAAQALRTRHDVAWDDPRAAALLGPELLGVLDRPAYRLKIDEIERCVRRIEEL